MQYVCVTQYMRSHKYFVRNIVRTKTKSSADYCGSYIVVALSGDAQCYEN